MMATTGRRKKGQPFFAGNCMAVNYVSLAQYEKLDTQSKDLFGKATDPEMVSLPPYYPRDPVLQKDWSTYLDTVRITDHHVGMVINRLKDEQLLDNTLIVFFTDHGISHARGKQFVDEGTHIPRSFAAQESAVVKHEKIWSSTLTLLLSWRRRN